MEKFPKPFVIPRIYTDYSPEEKASFEKDIAESQKEGRPLLRAERYYLKLKEEWKEMERQDDQPRYGH